MARGLRRDVQDDDARRLVLALTPGVVHEMGTCYMHPAYTAIRELAKEIGDKEVASTRARVCVLLG